MSDYRDRAAHRGSNWKNYDAKRNVLIVEIENDDGEEETFEIPARFDVCQTCGGFGKYVNPSIDAHGIGAEEWATEWDEEERERYMSGAYDIECASCEGRRVVPVPLEPEDPVAKRWLDWQEDLAACARED